MSNISYQAFSHSLTTQHLDVTLQGVLTVIGIVLSFLTNGLIVVLWFEFRSLRTAANCPILNLAITGLLDAVLNILTFFLFLLPTRSHLKYNYAVLNYFQVLECFSYFLNVLSILILMLGRYCAVAHKLRYYVWNTKYKSLMTIVVVWIASALLDAIFQVSLLSSWKKDDHRPVTYLEFKRSSYRQAKFTWIVILSVPMGLMIMFAFMINIYLQINLHKMKSRLSGYGFSRPVATNVKDVVVSESVVNLAALENLVKSRETSSLPNNLSLETEAKVNSAAPQSSEKKKTESEIGQLNKSMALKYHKDYSINVLWPLEIFLSDSEEKCSISNTSEVVSSTESGFVGHPGSANDQCMMQVPALISIRERNDLMTRRIRSNSDGQILRSNKETFPYGSENRIITKKAFCLEGTDISLTNKPNIFSTFSSTEEFSGMFMRKKSFKRKKRSQSELPVKTDHDLECGEVALLSFIDLNQNSLNGKTTRKFLAGVGDGTENARILRTSPQREHLSTSLQQDNEVGAHYNAGMNIEEETAKMAPNSSSSGFDNKIHSNNAATVKDASYNKEGNVHSTERSGCTVYVQTKRRRRQAEANLVKSKCSVLLCALAYIVCYTPFLVEIIIANSSFDIAADSRGLWLHFLSAYFILLNDICNPVLYCLKCDNFYQASISLLKIACKKFKRESIFLNHQQS